MKLVERLYRQVDTSLNYGREVVTEFAGRAGPARVILDIAAGNGADLAGVGALYPEARRLAFDWHPESLARLRAAGIEAQRVDLEREAFPLPPASVDLIIANQVIEHMKEVFWVFDQMARVLRPGGHLIVGIPNLASLHNRLLLMAGRQPTPIRTASAHVRGMTRADLIDFVEACFPSGFQFVAYAGSNFYPFPPGLARPLARWFPALAWANFYLFRLARPYDGGFARFPAAEQLETNFFTGARNPGPAAEP